MPPLIFPQQSTADALARIVDQALTLRLYSNARVPQVTDTAASYVEVVGGGYAAVALVTAQWAIAAGSPSVALYGSFIPFAFAAPPTNPNVCGYFVTNADGLVVFAEVFNPAASPFIITTPGQTIQIRPRFGADNLVAAPPEIL